MNLLDPDVIVLGGGLSRLPGLCRRCRHSGSAGSSAAGDSDPLRTRVVQRLHGDASGVRGAAWLWR